MYSDTFWNWWDVLRNVLGFMRCRQTHYGIEEMRSDTFWNWGDALRHIMELMRCTQTHSGIDEMHSETCLEWAHLVHYSCSRSDYILCFISNKASSLRMNSLNRTHWYRHNSLPNSYSEGHRLSWNGLLIMVFSSPSLDSTSFTSRPLPSKSF
jgi:hypothetical protein